jgi:DNA topoisomerase I
LLSARHTPSHCCAQPERLNEQLKDLMPGLSAKVFRTYNASITLQNELADMDPDTPVREGREGRAGGVVMVLPASHRRRSWA